MAYDSRQLDRLRIRVVDAAADIRQHHKWTMMHGHEVPEKVVDCVRREWWRRWRMAMADLRAAQGIGRTE